MADKGQNPCIYICFMATMTTIAKISRRISGCDYTHISIAFDGKLEDFVSFSRRSANTPLDAGIVWERRGRLCAAGGRLLTGRRFTGYRSTGRIWSGSKG